MSRKKWLLAVAAALSLAGCIASLPCLQTVSDDEGWRWSASNLKQIGLALRSYHEVYGRLPPAATYDRDGTPLYSWRVLLLPFLERQELFAQFDRDEPWDGPHNRPLLERIPRCYTLGMRNEVPGMTHYQAFVGPGTAFEQGGLTPGGLLVVEAADPVPWTKPADLVYIPGGPLPALGGFFQKPVRLWCYEIGSRPGFSAVFADGEVRFIRGDIDEQTLRGFISQKGAQMGAEAGRD